MDHEPSGNCAFFWYQNFADTRTLLTSELFWHENFTGIRTLLAPELFWY
jgi:hypothetical protein